MKWMVLVSGGNHSGEINIETGSNHIDELSEDEIQSQTLLEIFRNQRNRRLVSPAESINSITVGASHFDNSSFKLQGSLYELIKDPQLPSPINPVGSGFRRSVKPEVLMPGGRVLYRLNSQNKDSITLEPAIYPLVPPGIKVAYPRATEGEVNSVAYTM